MVLVRQDNLSFDTAFFLLTDDNTLYGLTFADDCDAPGALDKAPDGNGYPLDIHGKKLLIHSAARYELRGKPHSTGPSLGTRTSTPMLVKNVREIQKGEGISYASLGWVSTGRMPGGGGTNDALLVNDSAMTISVKDGAVGIRGGSTIDGNSVAPWARGDDYVDVRIQIPGDKGALKLLSLSFTEALEAKDSAKLISRCAVTNGASGEAQAQLKAGLVKVAQLRIATVTFRPPTSTDTFPSLTSGKTDVVCELAERTCAGQSARTVLLSVTQIEGGYMMFNGVAGAE